MRAAKSGIHGGCFNSSEPVRIRLRQWQCPGDVLVLVSSALEAIHSQYPDKFLTSLDVSHPSLFFHNPHVSQTPADIVVDLGYNPGSADDHSDAHFIHASLDKLSQDLNIPLTCNVKRPSIYLSDREKHTRNQVARETGYDGPFWLLNASIKDCYTVKGYGSHNYQRVVDLLLERGIRCVQVGDPSARNPKLDNVIDFVGKTDLRQLVVLAYHSQGCITGESFHNHLYAALNKPCVTLLSGFLSPDWVSYPTARTLHNHGSLPCCKDRPCWKAKVVPEQPQEQSYCVLPVIQEGKDPVPKCLDMIRPEQVADAVLSYYEGGVLSLDDKPTGTLMKPLRYSKRSTIGLVIGTYASVAHVHLQLECRRRFYPDVPVLIHDDGSPAHRELSALCRRYGADLHCSTTRAKTEPPGLGDLACYLQGLEWADRRGLDVLVKFSRRWIVARDWVPEFLTLIKKHPHHTYSSYCTQYTFGFRTECMAMHVASWLQFTDMMRSQVQHGSIELPEANLHLMAQRLGGDSHPDHDQPFGGCLVGYQPWYSMLGTSRSERLVDQLWHDSNLPDEYLKLAQRFRLKGYKAEDYEWMG